MPLVPGKLGLPDQKRSLCKHLIGQVGKNLIGMVELVVFQVEIGQCCSNLGQATLVAVRACKIRGHHKVLLSGLGVSRLPGKSARLMQSSNVGIPFDAEINMVC